MHNPLQALSEILASLHDSDGRVAVPASMTTFVSGAAKNATTCGGRARKTNRFSVTPRWIRCGANPATACMNELRFALRLLSMEFAADIRARALRL